MMGRILLVFLHALCHVATQQQHPDDPCLPTNHMILDDGRRSVTFVPGPTDSLICDIYNIVNGEWYRFKSKVGGKMPEHCVDTFHCGTQAPVWMNGHHPVETGVMVTRQACANFGYPDDCCTWKADIEVMRCYDYSLGEDYFVYRLPFPPGCNIGFCAGDKMPCPADHIFNDRTQQCEALYPQMSNVTLRNPVVEGEFVHFYCDVTHPHVVADDGARFEVNFYFDNVIHQEATITMNSPQTRVFLQEQFLRGNLGKSLSCGVRAYWDGFPGYKSEEIHSNSYFVGILVDPQHLVVSEKDDAPSKVLLRSTVPVVCKNPEHQGKCEITVRVVTPARLVTSQGTTRHAFAQCTYRITREDWKPDESLAYNESEPLDVMVKRDPYINEGSSQFIHFEKFPYGVPDILQLKNGSVEVYNKIWDGYAPNDVRVDILPDERMAACQSTSDPRVRTWDKGGYDILHRIGQFVLWRSTSSRVFEAHIRHWLCREAWFVACTCGVAVREGNVVLSVDMCGARQRQTPRPKVTQISDGDLRGASVTRDVTGRSFSINMPSGAYVKMDIHDWGMNVYAFAPSEDINKTEGLCGTFDGDARNDLMMQGSGRLASATDFVDSWRIPKGASLFDSRPHWVTVPEQNMKFCKCLGGRSMLCDWTQRVTTDVDVGKPSIPVNPLISKLDQGLIDENSRRKRRSIGARMRRQAGDPDADYEEDFAYSDLIDDDSESDDFDYGLGTLPDIRDMPWPTPTGITHQMARRACEQAIANASSYEICLEVPEVNVFEPIEKCVDDIRLMDDMDWAQNSVSEMEFQCLITAMQKNPSGDTSGRLSPQNIVRYMCPRQCSGRGRCLDGRCLCNTGFDGADCSLAEGQVPKTLYIPRQGLCDVMERPCRNIRVIADGLKDSEGLTCRVVQVEVTEGSNVVQRHTAANTNATMISSTEVSCEVPLSPVRLGDPAEGVGTPVHGMLLSVSNDGNQFSAELFLTVFDSTCLDCDPDAQCRQKESSCSINGHCFAEGEADPTNWCRACDPRESKQSFITRSNNEPPVFPGLQRIVKLADENLTMSLEATDPEDRPLRYSLVFSTDPSISLDSGGELSWPMGHNSEYVRMEVKAEDECGARTQGDFELGLQPCQCQNGGSCYPERNKPRGQGHYYCACANGYTGSVCESEINECRSNPCVYGQCRDVVGGFLCDCRKGYIGATCAEIAPLADMEIDGSQPVIGRLGVWSAWGPWGQCSHDCDYGIRLRRRVCERLPCTAEGSQARRCNTISCPATSAETNQGAVLVVQGTTIETVRVNEEDLLSATVDIVNAFCLTHGESCCPQSPSDSSRYTEADMMKVKDVHLAKSYPRYVNAERFGLKVIGVLRGEVVRAACRQVPSPVARRRRSADVTFIRAEVLREALETGKDSFAQMLRINVTGVLLTREFEAIYKTELDTFRHQGEPDEREAASNQLWWIIGATAIAVATLVAFTLLTVLVIKRRARRNKDPAACAKKRRRNERTNSQKHLTKNDELEESGGGGVEAARNQPSVATVTVAPPGVPSNMATVVDRTGSLPHAKAKAENQSKSQPSTISSEKFFFHLAPGGEDESDACSVAFGHSATNSVKKQYFYKYAINDGMGQVNTVDSSTIQLHSPSQCDFNSVSERALNTLGGAQQLTAQDDDPITSQPPLSPSQRTPDMTSDTAVTEPAPEHEVVITNGDGGRAEFKPGLKRVSSKQRRSEKPLAWKVFSDENY